MFRKRSLRHLSEWHLSESHLSEPFTPPPPPPTSGHRPTPVSLLSASPKHCLAPAAAAKRRLVATATGRPAIMWPCGEIVQSLSVGLTPGRNRVAGLGLVISNTSQKLSICGTYFSQCKTWRIRVRWILRWKFESVVSARRVWDSNPRLETSRRFWRALVFAQIVPEILFWLCSSIVQRREDVLGYIILEIQKNICKTLRENYRRKSSATSQWHFAC